jgi:hypothetical protein
MLRDRHTPPARPVSTKKHHSDAEQDNIARHSLRGLEALYRLARLRSGVARQSLTVLLKLVGILEFRWHQERIERRPSP